MTTPTRKRPAQAVANTGWPEWFLGAIPGLWIRFSADGRYLAAGGSQDAAVERANELIGKQLSEELPSDAAERVHRGIATALRTGHAEIQYRLVRDGAERVFDVVFAAHSTKDVTAFISDATERAAAEQRLIDSEQRFRNVVELANEGVWMIDAEGLTTYATPSMAAILGCTPEDMLGRSPREFMDEASRLAFAERQARRRRGETEGGAFTLRSVDGRDVPTTLAARPICDQDGRYIGAVALVTDETQRLKAERELDESRRRLGAIVEAHDDVFYVGEIMPDGSYFEHYCGPGSERLLGGELPPGGDNMGDTWGRAVHVQDRQVYADMNQRLSDGEAAELEYRMVGRDGRIRWVHDRARPRTSEDGRLVFDGVVSDITERRERADALQAALASVQAAHEELSAAHAASEHLARTDSLTGLFNRRHFTHALEAELARNNRGGQAPGIILIDIDHFKRINDSHGHESGDRVLREIATRLASAIRPYDVLARWGGEEFIILTPDLPDADTLKQIGEKLLAAIRSTPISTPAAAFEITASAGAAHRTTTETTGDALIAHADRALYAAKHRGRDCVVLANDTRTDDVARVEPEVIRLAEGLALAASIREALPPSHSKQVADLAAMTARELALDEPTQLRCRLAGWLHDIGKLAIPDHILANTTNLSDDEQQILRRHAEIGAAILAGIATLSDAAPGVRHHHEHYDGTGYPDSLHSDTIPLEARIVAAADTYTALTTTRRHQPALSHQDALQRLQELSGLTLDPTIIAALARSLTHQRATHPDRPPASPEEEPMAA